MAQVTKLPAEPDVVITLSWEEATMLRNVLGMCTGPKGQNDPTLELYELLGGADVSPEGYSVKWEQSLELLRVVKAT